MGMWKKVGFAVLVGGAVVVGNSYRSPMNTPTTEIEAFLSSVSDLKCEEGVSTMYSVFIDNGNTFPGERVCGQLCATPKTVQFIFPFAPPPKPKKGDCASFGFTTETGRFFDLGFGKASIFKRPYIEFKGRAGIGGNDLRCGKFGSQKAIEDYCNSNDACKGYSYDPRPDSFAFTRGGPWWCTKTTSEKGPLNSNCVWYQKPQQ